MEKTDRQDLRVLVDVMVWTVSLVAQANVDAQELVDQTVPKVQMAYLEMMVQWVHVVPMVLWVLQANEDLQVPTVLLVNRVPRVLLVFQVQLASVGPLAIQARMEAKVPSVMLDRTDSRDHLDKLDPLVLMGLLDLK